MDPKQLEYYQQNPTKKSIKVDKMTSKRADRLKDAWMSDIEGGTGSRKKTKMYES